MTLDVSIESVRIRLWAYPLPNNAPFGNVPAPRMPVRGLMTLLMASLRRSVWCICGMGNREGVRWDRDRSISSVVYVGPRSVGVAGGRGSGSVGDDGAARIGAAPTGLDHSHFSKSISSRGSGTMPNFISPSPAFVLCLTVPSNRPLVAPCVVDPRIKWGLVAGSGHNDPHRSSNTPIPFCKSVMTDDWDIRGLSMDKAYIVALVFRHTIKLLICPFGESSPIRPLNDPRSMGNCALAPV